MNDEVKRAETVLLLLHGRYYKPTSMRQLADRLGLPGIACVAPEASDRSWYPHRFMDPREANEPELSRAIAHVHEMLDGIEAQGVEPERTVLGGFSQGGCLACEALAQRPRPLAALIVLCGGLMGANEGELVHPPAGALDALPVLLTGTEQDDWIPVQRVERTADVLRAAGASVDMKIHPPADHEVHDTEVVAFRRLLLQLNRPRSR